MSSNLQTLRDRRGMALAMAVILTGVCTVIIAGLMQYILSEYRATHLDWRKVQALYCAEAGVEYAMDFLRSSQALPQAEVSLDTLGIEGVEGTFTVASEAVTNGTTADPGQAVRVTATGFVPSEADVLAGRGVSRRVVVMVGPTVWDFGTDAVRAKDGVDYGSNNNLTVTVDDNNDLVSRPDVNAAVRVTGTEAKIEAVKSVAANKAVVAGAVSAPGQVDIPLTNAQAVNSGPENYVANAFPDNATLGYDGANPANLIWPPAPGTWAEMYAREATGGAAIPTDASAVAPPAAGTVIQAPAYINLGGTGTLAGVILKGPGTIFVNGNIGGLTNGSPPATVVVRGTLYTSGNSAEQYRCIPEAPGKMAPPLVIFGRGTTPDTDGYYTSAECAGNSEWHFAGPMMALNPQGKVSLNDSAFNAPTDMHVGVTGAILANGKIYYKSAKAALGYPAAFAEQRFTMRSLPAVRSYSAR